MSARRSNYKPATERERKRFQIRFDAKLTQIGTEYVKCVSTAKDEQEIDDAYKRYKSLWDYCYKKTNVHAQKLGFKFEEEPNGFDNFVKRIYRDVEKSLGINQELAEPKSLEETAPREPKKRVPKSKKE